MLVGFHDGLLVDVRIPDSTGSGSLQDHSSHFGDFRGIDPRDFARVV